jgi:hypothetical protein
LIQSVCGLPRVWHRGWPLAGHGTLDDATGGATTCLTVTALLDDATGGGTTTGLLDPVRELLDDVWRL